MESKSLSLTLVGDVFLGADFDPGEAGGVREFLRQRPLTIANFEGALPGGTVRRKAVNLSVDRLATDYLPNTVLSLANNHVLDFGPAGLQATCKALGDAGISWFGLESALGAGDNFRILEQGGMRIALAGFGWRNEECVGATAVHPGVADFTRKNIDRTLDRLAAEQFDFLLVYVHFGYEHEYYPLPLHVGLCRYLIDRGVHLVFGSHTHCVQAYEIYQGKYIFYGLGNFCFSPGHDRYPADSDRGLIVELALIKEGAAIQVEGIKSIQYFRDRPGFEIRNDDAYLERDQLNISSLDNYGRDYKRIRSRKRNPRPVMLYERALTNELKYRFWLVGVRLTGYLGIRQVVKKLLGWT
jgi:poly-gamma-glutamate capsule biosynthesis protein CapA/YwtB (metallophosphatase superfamily)